MEGVRADVGGVFEEAQELRRARVEDHLGLGVDPPPGAAELDHRQAGLPGQALDIGLQGSRGADAVAEDIAPPNGGLRRQGGPVLRRQQQGGVQDHGDLPPGDFPDDLPALALPDGDVGEGREVAFQLLLHAVGHPGHAEGGGVGDLPQGGEGAEEDGVKAPVGEDDGVPDLVAAGDQQVVGQGGAPQLLQAPVAARRQGQVGLGEGLEPQPALPQGRVVEGAVGVPGGPAGAGRGLEDADVLVDEIVDGLAVPAQGGQGPLGGHGLENGPVVVQMVEGDKSRFQKDPSFLARSVSAVQEHRPAVRPACAAQGSRSIPAAKRPRRKRLFTHGRFPGLARRP